jgi:SAM-dependent methyltransferase
VAVYDEAAVWYDRMWGQRRDYAADAAAIIELVDRQNPTARRLLDVGCATGEHLRHLQPRFDTAGVDLSAGLLELARRKLGDTVVLHHADMFDLDLDARFDVITCLWGTIAYATTEPELRQVATRFAEHLEPGGVVVVEPWLTPRAFDDTGRVTVAVDEDADPVLSVVTTTRRDGDVAWLRRLYVAASAGEIRTVDEEHTLGLFDQTVYRAAFTAAGFDVEWHTDGLAGRGLLVGTRR